MQEILSKEKRMNGQTAVSLKELVVLFEGGAKFIDRNKEVGNCYCTVVDHSDRIFFSATGGKFDISFKTGYCELLGVSKYNSYKGY